MSSTPTYSTKNTKDNRKVVVADYNFPKAIFKIPDGLDLEDKTLVQEWFVKKMYLNIIYVDGTCEEIPWEWDPTEEGVDWKYPDFQIEDAEDCGIDYSEDEKEEVEEDEDKEEVEVKDEVETEEEDDEENTTKCECCGAINACAFPEGYELVKKAE